MHTFVGATLGLRELFGVVAAESFTFRPCVVALPIELLVEGGQGLPFGFHRVLRGGGFSSCGGEISTNGGCFGCGLLRRLACGVEVGLEPVTFFFALAAGLIEFIAQLGRGVALTLGRLLRGQLCGLSGNGVESRGIGVLACLLKLGVALRQFGPVLRLSRRQLVVRRRHRGFAVGPNLCDFGLRLLTHQRRFSDRVVGQRIGFFAFTLGSLCALVSQSGGPLSSCAASIGLGHLSERVAVCILHFRPRRFDIAGGADVTQQVVEVSPQVRDFLRQFA